MAESLSRALGEVSVATVALPEKRPPGTIGRKTEFRTNLTSLTLKPNVPFYKYDVRMYVLYKGADGREIRKELTKQIREDFPEQERKIATVQVYKHLLKFHIEVFPSDGALFYDRAAILFSAGRQLPRVGTEGRVFELPPTVISNGGPDAEGVRVIIKRVTEGFQVTSNDLARTVSVRDSDRDIGLLEVLNLAMSQKGYLETTQFITYGSGVHYLFDHRSLGFEDYEVPKLMDGKYTGIGLTKSVKALEGEKGQKLSAFVVTDVKKGAFHKDDQNLFEKISQMSIFVDQRSGQSRFSVEAAMQPFNQKAILQLIRGLYVRTQYGRKRTFPIGGIGQPASQLKFQINKGTQWTVQEYFEKHYNITLRYPHMFTVSERRNPHTFYPVELLSVAPSQRVTLQQQTPEQVVTMIRASATLPQKRLNQTRVLKEALNIKDGNPHLKFAGVGVASRFTMHFRIAVSDDYQAVYWYYLYVFDFLGSDEGDCAESLAEVIKRGCHLGRVAQHHTTILITLLLQVPGRVLPSPTIVYGNNKYLKPVDNCNWSSDRYRYVEPAKLRNWAICCTLTTEDRRRLYIKDYAERIEERCRLHGMETEPCSEIYALEPQNYETLMEWYASQKQKNRRYLMFITSDNIKQHDLIKLLEIEHQIVSQEIKGSKVDAVLTRSQTQTLDNVVSKVNVKLGGVNYNIMLGSKPKDAASKWLGDKDRMFVGFEISNPPAVSRFDYERTSGLKMPSVLGWGANCARNSQQYLGDYIYVEPRQADMMGPYLGELIVDILKRFRAATNIAPRHLVLYFSGISEGRWSMVASTYIQAIKNGIRSLSPNYKPLITALTVSKDHNERIYKAIISGNRASEQNIPPGTVIDTKIVSPVINEFYLNAHSAFQGTARTPKYALVYDDSQIPVDVIEGMTHGLCYLHQIITATVSLPVPLIVADRCAKRGHNVYIANSRQRDPVGSIEEANMRLVNHGPLQKVRYNA